jgi:hypothetical protein
MSVTSPVAVTESERDQRGGKQMIGTQDTVRRRALGTNRNWKWEILGHHRHLAASKVPYAMRGGISAVAVTE